MDKLTLALFQKLEERIRSIDLRQGGPRGAKGRRGEKGATGSVGPRGESGPQGPQGPAGPKGDVGPQGKTGPAGKNGRDGLNGAVGPAGADGRDGRDGTDGVGVFDAKIDFDGRLTLYLTDGTEIDAGLIHVDGEGDITYVAGGGVPDKYKNDLYDHINDLNNPHQTTHLNLFDNPNGRDWTANPHETTVVNLDDTDITDPDFGESLIYDGDLGKWVNGEARHQLSESNPTGLVDGGELNIGPGPNDIEVIAGEGIIVDSYTNPIERPAVQAIQWPQINEAITAAPAVAGSVVYFTIYDTGVAGTPINNRPTNVGALRQYATPPTEPTRRDEIFLGVAVHNGDGWGEISSPIVVNNAAHTLAEYLKRVAGPTFVIDGGQVDEAASFTISQEPGTVWEHNRNWHVNKKDPHREAIPGAAALTFKYVNRDFTDVSAATTIVDPTQWDDAGSVSPVPGPANTATVQRLYVDPRDNYWILWGQDTYANATEAAASIEAPTEIPPILEASVLLAYIVTEKAKTDWDSDEAFILYPPGGGGVGGGGVPITTYLQLSDTPGAYTGDKRKVATVDDLESNIVHDYRTKAVQYIDGNEYYEQEMVWQDGWLMVANKTTVDYPAPQPVGDPAFVLPDEPPFQEFSNVSVVESGTLYTFTSSGYYSGFRVWLPEVGPDISYRVIAVRNPNTNPTTTVFSVENVPAGQWALLSVSRQLLLAGEELFVVLQSVNSGSNVSPGDTPADWFRTTSSNTAVPTDGQWNTNVQESLLRIHEDTADAVLINFLGVVPGSTFNITSTTDPNVSIEYLANSGETYFPAGGYYTWDVTVAATGTNGTPAPGERCIIEITVPVSAATKFVGIDSYWGPGTLPSWAGIQSTLEYDGVPQAIQGDEAYGVDISFQELTISPDWDVFGLPSGGAGGGTGGSSTLGGLDDVTLTAPAEGEHLVYNSSTQQWENQESSGGGATESTITQAGHGFAIADAVRFDGISWVKAQADDITTTALGIVVAVQDVNTFTFAVSGRYQLGLLNTNEWYYLSDTVAGGLQTNEPTISQPIVYSEDGTWSIITPYRPSYATPASEPIVGEIKPFYGDVADLTFGWHLCDGTNGTPDLRGRALFAADGSNYIEGGFGGALPGSRDSSTNGSHSHTTSTAGAHTHNLQINFDTSRVDVANSPANQPVAQNGHTHSGSALSDGSHNHGNTGSTGNHQHTVTEIDPQHFVLTGYIMYTGVL